jgi:peptide/nickel transport system substrate-binding protein
MSEHEVASYRSAFTRRAFVKSVALGAAAFAGGTKLATLPAFADAGTLVWGKKLEATLYDPATSILASSWEILHTVYDGLTDLDANMQPVPGLAESWQQPNPSTYVFKLRPGVKFSNGREMTTDDVVGSLKRLIDPKTGSFFAGQMGKVKSIEPTGADSVTIELEEPYAPLLTALASTMASIVPMKEVTDGSLDLSKAMLGTGPYMVESHAQGDNWMLVRNPHYWQKGLPTFDKLFVRIIPSDQAMVAALRDGSIDVAQFDSSPDAKLLLQAVDNVEVIQNEQTNLFWMVLNAVAEKSPFRNEKVRQATSLAIDRDKIAQIAMGGSGQPTSALAPVFNACDTGKLAYFTRDVEKSKALLKEAGVDSLTFELLIAPEVAWQAMGQVIKENLAEVGLTVNLVSLDEGSLIKHVWVDNPGTFEAALIWYAGYSDASMLPLWWIPKRAGFTAGYQNEDTGLIAAVETMRAMALDDPKRNEALQRVCELIDANSAQLPLITRVETMAYRKDKIDASAIRHKDGYANNLMGVEIYKRL